MATKPLEQPEIWASALLYSSGPKAGQPTKATSESGAAPEGHKPGPTEPTTANEFNVFEFKMSLLARWVFEGRFDKAADAHPVETDTLGLLSARAADFGDATQPGPSLLVSHSNTDWAQRIDVIDADGLRLLGTYAAGVEKQLVLVNTSMDNTSQFPAVRVTSSGIPSCGGIEVSMAASGVINGEDLRASLNVYNTGGTGAQVRTQDTILPALRVLARENDATSAQFGHGSSEAGSKKNLDGTAIDCRGGDADGTSLKSNAGTGGLFQGGDFTTVGTNKFAGHGIIALSGLTSTSIAGGAAVFAQTVGPRGIAIEASHNDSGATLPVITATTGDNAADGIEVVCEGTGVGIDVLAEGQAGIRITMDLNGAFDIGEAILMTLQVQPPTSVSAGSLWAEQNTGIPAMRMGVLGAAGLDGSGYGYVRRTMQAPCYAHTPFIASFVMTGSPTDQVISGDFTFQAGLLPQQASLVVIRLWGRVSQDNTAATSATFEVRDKTVGGDPAVLSVEINTRDSTETGQDKHSCTFSQLYQLPAAGARTFDLVWSGTVGSASGDFRGWVEIEEICGS